jgi:hypothetical protein
MPDNANLEQVRARYENGVLVLDGELQEGERGKRGKSRFQLLIRCLLLLGVLTSSSFLFLPLNTVPKREQKKEESKRITIG